MERMHGQECFTKAKPLCGYASHGPPGHRHTTHRHVLAKERSNAWPMAQDFLIYIQYPFLSSFTPPPSTTARSPTIAALMPFFPPSPLLACHTYTPPHTHTTFRRSGSSKRRRERCIRTRGAGGWHPLASPPRPSSFFSSHHEEGCSTQRGGLAAHACPWPHHHSGLLERCVRCRAMGTFMRGWWRDTGSRGGMESTTSRRMMMSSKRMVCAAAEGRL